MALEIYSCTNANQIEEIAMYRISISLRVSWFNVLRRKLYFFLSPISLSLSLDFPAARWYANDFFFLCHGATSPMKHVRNMDQRWPILLLRTAHNFEHHRHDIADRLFRNSPRFNFSFFLARVHGRRSRRIYYTIARDPSS